MNLPKGVFDRPRQPILIAKNEWAIIRIETGQFPINHAYEIKEHSYREAIAPCLRGDWEEFDRLFGLKPRRSGAQLDDDLDVRSVAYSVAEHIPAGDSQRLPDITVVPNLFTNNALHLISPWIVLGTSLGHYHPLTESGYHVQEVYEFQGYGVMILDHGGGEVELWVAQDGDKVAIPTACHMTLYNLGDHPLVTLHFAQASHKPDDSFVQKHGPIMLAYYNDFEVVFKLNPLYINNTAAKIGVRVTDAPRQTRERQVRILRGARLELGRLLYEQLSLNPDLIGEFARLGVRVRTASPEAVLEPLQPYRRSRLYFRQSLVRAATKGTDVYRYFFPASRLIGPPPFSDEQPRINELNAERSTNAIDDMRGDSSHRHILIVLEGSGDWVEQTYRPLFKNKVDEYKKRPEKDIALSVIYADDSRWKPRPVWSDPITWSDPQRWEDPARTGLQEWEVYLDKADPDGAAQYFNLRPDVVFIVTPDFTHCALARQWIGKTPLVFIEKPFDSQITNVENLLLTLGQQHKAVSTTEILGLDHYQLYARPINLYKPEINAHLGGHISAVNFYLTETRPIEQTRVRTLQYGLTLDLLPHFIALLTYFGDIGSIDEITVVGAGQYQPLVAALRDGQIQESIIGQFEGETYSQVQFTFLDHSGNDFPIPCRAIVGKGFSREVKYMEVIASNHNAIRIDLNRKPEGEESEYPWDSLMFLQGDGEKYLEGSEEVTVSDPYSSKPLRILRDPNDPKRLIPPLDRQRYQLLLKDLLEQKTETIGNTLTRSQGRQIVLALDRIWWAIREAHPWRRYNLGSLDPLNPENDLATSQSPVLSRV